MEQYYDSSWLDRNNWDKWGEDDQKGMLNEVTKAMTTAAFSLIREGRVYDLETERFKGMPIWDGHCGFEILSYASPNGRRGMAKSAYGPAASWNAEGGMFHSAKNEYNLGLNSEMIVAPLHAGTHIDALCHWTAGADDHWYGGYSAHEYGTNFGPANCDIAQIAPITLRGVLLDIAGYKGLAHLQPNYIITPEDCEGCAKWAGIELRRGDAVLLRTGEAWPGGCLCPNAGLGVAAARYLAEGCGSFVIGDDMASLDGFHKNGDSSWPNHPSPVHHYLLIQQGIHILELLQLDELATDRCYEFCFICAAPKVRSATGMYVRPLAII